MIYVLTWLINLVSLGLVACFFFFSYFLPPEHPKTLPTLQNPSAIVVLTGRQGRIEDAFSLYLQTKATYLYVSGVDPKVKNNDLIKTYGMTQKQLECCIIYGDQAENTLENAYQTAAWANRENIQSIVLVTDQLHMRRAQLLFNEALSDIPVIPYATSYPALFENDLWKQPTAWMGYIKEYAKYVFIRMMTMVS